MFYPPRGYKPLERQVRLGSGEERFESAAKALMTWGVQRGSGIQITEVDEGTGIQYEGIEYNPDGSPRGMREPRVSQDVFADGGSPFIRNGMSAVLRVQVGPFHFSAPVRVVAVVDEPNRRGFAYGTLKGHPESGEELFLVEFREDGTVWFVLRALSRPSNALFWIASPLLGAMQRRFTARYLRSLLPARAG
ncbi:conserved hypothetical protein [Leifsonia xyli subsp. xyli str. CTCB07]|uniref:DUF1990 domain-containing protein n=2 Tax=Leifsonia xyli subsp. xyli TaxID=59736 RepID=Q6AEB6_LEIXX|nr:conserved hypothetical protein [Leifsonia xyli subsp. xyli str. CTCB07]